MSWCDIEVVCSLRTATTTTQCDNGNNSSNNKNIVDITVFFLHFFTCSTQEKRLFSRKNPDLKTTTTKTSTIYAFEDLNVTIPHL